MHPSPANDWARPNCFFFLYFSSPYPPLSFSISFSIPSHGRLPYLCMSFLQPAIQKLHMQAQTRLLIHRHTHTSQLLFSHRSGLQPPGLQDSPGLPMAERPQYERGAAKLCKNRDKHSQPPSHCTVHRKTATRAKKISFLAQQFELLRGAQTCHN